MTIAEDYDILKLVDFMNERDAQIWTSYSIAYLRTVFHLWFDEPEKMFLIHAARVVDVGIHFTNIIEISGPMIQGFLWVSR